MDIYGKYFEEGLMYIQLHKVKGTQKKKKQGTGRGGVNQGDGVSQEDVYEGGRDSHGSYSDSGQLEKYLKRKKRQRSRTIEEICMIRPRFLLHMLN
ncbi:hypothetical protein FH972_005087 [Carpinus fangiana]|uniref:Uncharacterized protein n=1 Tax=Carpinus fangiana TaxID=176857 RepID=A0A5N6QQL1_9ROSI|nr:hypothetical protein FH972_005087 [Carpinus fangiana]